MDLPYLHAHERFCLDILARDENRPIKGFAGNAYWSAELAEVEGRLRHL